MFYFSGLGFSSYDGISNKLEGFPHSEIPGLSLATQLPEAYRSYATSFFPFWCLGILHIPLSFLSAYAVHSHITQASYVARNYVTHSHCLFSCECSPHIHSHEDEEPPRGRTFILPRTLKFETKEKPLIAAFVVPARWRLVTTRLWF